MQRRSFTGALGVATVVTAFPQAFIGNSSEQVMTLVQRVLGGLVLSAMLALFPAASQAADQVIRIGYQKYGNLILLKGKGDLEKKLAPLGYKVVWTEFPSGPPLLEALNVGAIDLGHAGEAPPIFAQAAGAAFLYVAHEPPAPAGEAILVP